MKRSAPLILAMVLISQLALAADTAQTELSRSFMRTGSSRDAEALASELTRVPKEFEAKRNALVKFLLSEDAKTEAGSPEEYRARGLMLDLVVTQARDSLYWQEFSKNLTAAQRQRYVATGTGILIGAALGVFFNRLQVIKPIKSMDPAQQYLNVSAANTALQQTAAMEAEGLRQVTTSLSPLATILTGKQVPIAEVERGIEEIVNSMGSVGPRFAPAAPVSVWTRIQNYFLAPFAPESSQYVSLASADEALEKAVQGHVNQLGSMTTVASEVPASAQGYVSAPFPGFEPIKQFAWGEGQMPLEAAEAAYRDVAFAVQSLKNGTGGFPPLPGSTSLEAIAENIRNPSPMIGSNPSGFPSFPPLPGTVGPRLIPIPFTSWQVAYVAGGVPGRSAVTRPAVGALLGGTFAFAADSFNIIGVRSLEPPIVSPQKRKTALTTETGLDVILDPKKKTVK